MWYCKWNIICHNCYFIFSIPGLENFLEIGDLVRWPALSTRPALLILYAGISSVSGPKNEQQWKRKENQKREKITGESEYFIFHILVFVIRCDDLLYLAQHSVIVILCSLRDLRLLTHNQKYQIENLKHSTIMNVWDLLYFPKFYENK